MRLTFQFILLIFCNTSYAQTSTVDTIEVYNKAMNKKIKTVVIIPSSDKNKNYPVVYLLHGYTGRYDNWISKMPTLKELSQSYQTIIVCPDGANSWYIDNPADSNIRYENFITKDLIPQIDQYYPTIANKEKRAITGLSMGGHGALMLAIRNNQLFGAASSMSGAVDLLPLLNRYELNKTIGDTITYKNEWKKYSVMQLTDSIANNQIRMMIDCGINDIFIGSNRALHEKLINRKINHDYIERNGEHNWSYWTNALPFHLLFFKKYFDEGKKL